MLVIGIGNSLRGDDCVGTRVVETLSARSDFIGSTRSLSGEAATLMDAWAGEPSVILVDAACAGQQPGEIMRFNVSHKALPTVLSENSTSTHGFGLAEAIELARVLGELPRRVIVYAIEGREYAIGQAPSPAIPAAITETVERIVREARDFMATTADEK